MLQPKIHFPHTDPQHFLPSNTTEVYVLLVHRNIRSASAQHHCNARTDTPRVTPYNQVLHSTYRIPSQRRHIFRSAKHLPLVGYEGEGGCQIGNIIRCPFLDNPSLSPLYGAISQQAFTQKLAQRRSISKHELLRQHLACALDMLPKTNTITLGPSHYSLHVKKKNRKKHQQLINKQKNSTMPKPYRCRASCKTQAPHSRTLRLR